MDAAHTPRLHTLRFSHSNLVAGAQKLVPNQPLVYGQSITDGCIDWKETRALFEELAAAVRARRK